MDDGWALPAALRGATFSAADAKAHGVAERRLRSGRATQLHHGVWADAGAALSVAQRASAALRATSPDAWISHATAAHLLGLRVPPRLRSLDRIDVTVPAPMHAPRGRGVRGRQRTLDPAAIALTAGVRASSPAQAFVDGADYLAFADLVALGDGIVDLRRPLASAAELRRSIEAHRGQRGHRRLLAASHAVRPTSRSWAETVTRLELEAMGAPPAWWNVPVRLPGGEELAPDAAFWQAGVLLEVEGDQHRTDRAQWLTDLDRYSLVQRYDLEPHRIIVTSPAETRARLRPVVDRILRRWDPSRRAAPIAGWYAHPPTFPDGWLCSAA